MSEIQELNADDLEVQKYLKGEIPLDSLTDEQADLAYQKYTENNDQNTEKEEDVEVESKEDKQEESKESNTVIQPLDKDKKIADLLSELNRERQIAQDRDKKLKDLKENPEFRRKFLGEEPKKPNLDDVDMLSDEYLAQIAETKAELAELKQWRKEREERESSFEESNRVKSEQNALFDEINNLQSEYPMLKTKENFKSIDDKFVEWSKIASMGNIDTEKYIKDESYRKDADSKGYKINVDPADLQKAYKIYQAHSKYRESRNSGYKTSLSREFKDLPDYEELIKSKYLSHEIADNEAFKQKIAERSTEAGIMNPGSGGADGINEAQINALMDEMDRISHKTNPSSADNKRFDEILRIIDNYK